MTPTILITNARTGKPVSRKNRRRPKYRLPGESRRHDRTTLLVVAGIILFNLLFWLLATGIAYLAKP